MTRFVAVVGDKEIWRGSMTRMKSTLASPSWRADGKMPVFLGIGTGRCGTVSLARLLDAQPGVVCTHERRPLIPWCDGYEEVKQHIKYFKRFSSGILVGDVAFYWLPYLCAMFDAFPGLKVIALKRDKKETVLSYLKKTKGRNHWMPHDGTMWKHDPVWDKCYPKYDARNKEEALQWYWEDYYRAVEEWMYYLPKQVRVWDVDVLNSEEGQDEIFEFLGLKEHVHILPCRFNVGRKG